MRHRQVVGREGGEERFGAGWRQDKLVQPLGQWLNGDNRTAGTNENLILRPFTLGWILGQLRARKLQGFDKRGGHFAPNVESCYGFVKFTCYIGARSTSIGNKIRH